MLAWDARGEALGLTSSTVQIRHGDVHAPLLPAALKGWRQKDQQSKVTLDYEIATE